MKKILILTFYYEPDLCAGSFRVSPLVKTLRDLAPSEVQMDVLSTMPNRYATFRKVPPPEEENPRPGLRILRISLPLHRSGMLDQARSFMAYACGVWRHVRGQKYDLVVASSSRLMTAFLASRVAAAHGSRLFLDIRDIFIENMEDVIPHGLFSLIRPIFRCLEISTYHRADRINLISPAFRDYFSEFPGNRLSTFTNGIDDEFLGLGEGTARPTPPHGITRILYAGNIGEGQGLERILPAIAKNLGDKVKFEVVGDGGRRRQLLTALRRQGIRNVEWFPPMERSRLLSKYREADILFLHLNRHPAFRRLLPSKIFEYAGTGKPIWAGLCGFSREFAQQNIDNCAVFESGDVDEALRVFSRLRPEFSARLGFVEKFRRRKIDQAMASDIIRLLDA